MSKLVETFVFDLLDNKSTSVAFILFEQIFYMHFKFSCTEIAYAILQAWYYKYDEDTTFLTNTVNHWNIYH